MKERNTMGRLGKQVQVGSLVPTVSCAKGLVPLMFINTDNKSGVLSRAG